MNKTILVTGADGQVGNEIRQLSAKHSQFHFLFTDYPQLDITDRSKIEEYFNKNKIDVVINCAAYTAVDKAETEIEKARSINTTAVQYLAETCNSHHIPFIHISTDFVFDGKKKTSYTEEDIPNPLSVYAATKLEGDRQAIRINPKTVVVRTSWVYSPFGNNFVKTMLRLSETKPELRVVSDQTGSPTYARDLAEALLTIAVKAEDVKQYGIFNYSNEGNITWYDFAKVILEIKGIQTPVIPITSAEYPTPAKRPFYSTLDLTKIQRVYGVTIKNWKSSLSDCLEKL